MQKKKITYTSLLADESIHELFETALERVEGELGRHHPMHIGSEDIFTEREITVASPIDSDIVIGYFADGTQEEARAAVDEAKRAFEAWSGLDWHKRVEIFRSTANQLEEEMFDLAALITYEAGKNRYEALAEVGEAIDFLRYYSSHYEAKEGFILPMSSQAPEEECRSVLRPHGVWTVISPFNFPLALAAGMASAALITGNTIVLKPTSRAPYSCLKLYHAFVNNGVAPGAVNLVTGAGQPFGDAIVNDPDVAGIAFTGSRAAGMWLYRNFAANQPYPKPVVLEMGSKNPTIITATADVQDAVEGVVRAAFGFSGQKCSATSRVYVQNEIAAEFINTLKKRTEQLVVKDPRKKDSFIGPLISGEALATFRDAVETARNEGGTIITGGTVFEDEQYAKGCYVAPTIVTGLPENHRLVRDELFVPFLIVNTYDTLEEALENATHTEYGLTAGIFTGEREEMEFFFNRIRFGVTYANRKGGSTTGAWPGAQPFGGWKGSGSTGRGVGGPHYLYNFLREQAQTRIFGQD